MEEPTGKSSFARQFPTFRWFGRVLFIMYRMKVTRYVLLPLILLFALAWGLLKYNDHILTMKYKQADRDLVQLSIVIGQYKDKVGQYPKSMDDLVQSGIITIAPIDPFNRRKEPYRIINLNNGAMVRVYSVGEDGVDNHSIKDYVEVVHEETYYGEKGFGLYETLQIEWTKDDPNNGMSDFMRGMLAAQLDPRDPVSNKITLICIYGWDKAIEYLKKNEARLKAGIPYTKTSPVPGLPIDFAELDFANLIPSATDIQDYFSRNETAFDLVRQGVGKPYTKGIMPDQDVWAGTPIPRFLQAQMLAKTMVAYGKMLEHEGRNEEAMSDYLAVVRLGQAQGCSPSLIGFLINMGIDSIAYKPVHDCVLSSDFESGHLLDLIKQIEALEKSETRFSYACHGEHLGFSSMLDDMKISDRPTKYDTPQSTLSKLWSLWLIANREKSRRNNKLIWDQTIARVEAPFPEGRKMDTGIPSGMDYLNRSLFFDASSLNVRLRHSQAQSTAAKLLLGLRYCKSLHNSYPNTLDAIRDLYETPPTDPFTTKPFIYEKTGDGFLLYSPGPELVDDKGVLEYDPTNGTVSSGDIVFSTGD